MPSTNQPATGEAHASKEQRFIQSDIDILPLLRGVGTREQAQRWAREMNQSDREFPDSYYDILTEGIGE